MRQVSQTRAGGSEAAAAFDAAVAGLRSGREQAQAARPELLFEEAPAPRTLAPFAAAVGAAVREGDDEVASGRFVVLHDPAGQPGWAGAWRVVVYIRAEVEAEIAADPLLGQVAWSWLTEALEGRGARYAAPSGTVTRIVTEGFGRKGGEPPTSSVELRASWSPAGAAFGAADAGARGDAGEQEPEGEAGLDDHLAAWCAALCAASGLPPLAAGVTALRAPSRRRGP